jgi:hypothetical protein
MDNVVVVVVVVVVTWGQTTRAVALPQAAKVSQH